jgi:hypothetical protein
MPEKLALDVDQFAGSGSVVTSGEFMQPLSNLASGAIRGIPVAFPDCLHEPLKQLLSGCWIGVCGPLIASSAA